MAPLSGATRVAGLVGGPGQVLHSRSPAIHNSAYAALGLDWAYVGFPVAVGGVPSALAGLRAAGVAGVNVTMPHKLAAARAVDRLEGVAAALGAVNTVQMLAGELIGWNTDADGLTSFLTREAGVTIKGASAVVVGSGGSARAVIAGLALAGADRVTVLARDPAKAAELAPLATGAAFAAGSLGVPEAADVLAAADLVVHATPVGQAGEAPLIPVAALRPGAVLVDLVYHPEASPLVVAATRQGLRAYGGLGMLVHQAALAFEIFTGVPAPVAAMWAGARGAA